MNNLVYKPVWDEGYFYYGRTKDLQSRLHTHLKLCRNNKKGGQFQNIFNKYGKWDEVEVIKDTLSPSDCKYLEQKKLDRWFSTKLCVNASPSSDGGATGGVSIEICQKMSVKCKKYWADPKNRLKQSIARKKYFENPENRLKQSILTKKAMEKPEVRTKLSIAQKKRFEDPKERIKASINTKKLFEDPEHRLKHSIATKKGMANPETKAKIRQATKGRRHTKESKLKISIAGKKRYADPKNRIK